jgi:hypothetical protein
VLCTADTRSPDGTSIAFLPAGEKYLHFGLRATPKAG